MRKKSSIKQKKKFRRPRLKKKLNKTFMTINGKNYFIANSVLKSPNSRQLINQIFLNLEGIRKPIRRRPPTKKIEEAKDLYNQASQDRIIDLQRKQVQSIVNSSGSTIDPDLRSEYIRRLENLNFMNTPVDNTNPRITREQIALAGSSITSSPRRPLNESHTFIGRPPIPVAKSRTPRSSSGDLPYKEAILDLSKELAKAKSPTEQATLLSSLIALYPEKTDELTALVSDYNLSGKGVKLAPAMLKTSSKPFVSSKGISLPKIPPPSPTKIKQELGAAAAVVPISPTIKKLDKDDFEEIRKSYRLSTIKELKEILTIKKLKFKSSDDKETLIDKLIESDKIGAGAGDGAGDGESLNTNEINDYMHGYRKFGYKGCFAADQIGDIRFNKREKQISFIFNLDPINKIKEKHLEACVIDLSPNERSICIFDSYGEDDINTSIQKQLKKIIDPLNLDYLLKMKFNRICLQGASSNCGWYSMKFIIDMIEGKGWGKSSYWDDALCDESLKGEKDIKLWIKRFGAKFKKDL